MAAFQVKKLYYSISEVVNLVEVEAHVLRYWEQEIDMLKPAKNLSGNRIYTESDIQVVMIIKKLLKEKKYTLEGAREYLRNKTIKMVMTDLNAESLDEAKKRQLAEIRSELNYLLERTKKLSAFIRTPETY